jgi:hypothetical protein
VSRGRAIVVLCIAATLLALVWRILPTAAPPLYDGLCLADPYRILGTNPSPTSASKQYGVGQFKASEVLTSETPAQALLLMPDLSFKASAPFTVTLSPVRRPASSLPAGRTFDGNVYSMLATTSSGTPVEPIQPVTILLRATGSTGPTRVIERLDGRTWTPLQTFNAGCGDTFEAASSRLGEFAVVKLTSPPGRSGAPVDLIVGAIVAAIVLAVAGVLITVVTMRAQTRRRASGGDHRSTPRR